MARSRSITLKGAAAGAFVEALMGRAPKDDDAKHMRVATFIHAEMKSGNEKGACALVKLVAEKGLDAAIAAIG